MDSQANKLEQWKKIASNRRFKTLVIAVLVLVVLVMLQVGNLRQHAPMCDLLANCTLRQIDLHRMQIALSKSRLSEFQVEGNRLLVPKAKLAQYLQAVTEHNAIPPELRTEETASPLANPFLSRSQQVSIERETRKQHIQDMVIRLPFVEQAWFEMDMTEHQFNSTSPQQSAVMSIRPLAQQPLLDHQVKTVREMIAGAVTGMDPQQIVVIDLNSGYAFLNENAATPADREISQARAVLVRQQRLEAELREALCHLSGLRVQVLIEEGIPLKKLPSAMKSPPADSVSDKKVKRTALSIAAGANGQASIFESVVDAKQPAVHALAGHQTDAPSNVQRISVLIDVPTELLRQRYSASQVRESEKTISKLVSTRPYSAAASSAEPSTAETEQQLANLKEEIRQTVERLIGDKQAAETVSISLNLIPSVTQPTGFDVEKWKTLAQQNWPSLAVLAIGLVLISLVTQSGRAEAGEFLENSRRDRIDHRMVDQTADKKETRSGAVHSFDSDQRPADLRSAPTPQHDVDQSGQAAEHRLSELLDNNPEAAAKVIQQWIRDAA